MPKITKEDLKKIREINPSQKEKAIIGENMEKVLKLSDKELLKKAREQAEKLGRW